MRSKALVFLLALYVNLPSTSSQGFQIYVEGR